MTKVSKLQYAIGKAAEKPLVNPLKNARSRRVAPQGDDSKAPNVPQHPENGLAASNGAAKPIPKYRIDKQPFAAYLPTGYRQRLRMYQARFATAPTLADILAEALADFFTKHAIDPVPVENAD